MSHVVAIEVQIKSLDDLAKAAVDLGAELVRRQKTHKWYGKWVNDYSAEDAAYKHGIKPEDYGKCDHAIKHGGCDYEIGVVDNHDGTFKLIADEWHTGRLIAKFGKGLCNLVQRYSVHRTTSKMKSMGFAVREAGLNADGSIKLECTRFASVQSRL